jgi:hypothetical protein
MQFYVRFIHVALLDCNCMLAIFPLAQGLLRAVPQPGALATDRPTDAALLARDWIATSAPMRAEKRRFISLPECCEQLSLDADAQRVALLAVVDLAGDYDNDEAWERLEQLRTAEPQDDDEPLFDAPRLVPELDQLNLFAA